MKILLDENIDVKFKSYLNVQGMDVFTVRDMGWTGMKNGQLLKLIKEHHFDCWIVVDKNIPYQQNSSNIDCIIIVLDVYRNTLKHLMPFVNKILQLLTTSPASRIIVLKEN